MVKIIFFGNSKYSVIGAGIINDKFPISLVVTVPDKPKGRDKVLTPSPTKFWAQGLNIPLLETDNIDSEIISRIKKLKPDFFIVEDYGLILPKELLDLPKYASLNIHHSLLPKYRGAAPVPATILNGDKTSGVTIIEMDEKMDTGDILAQCEHQLEGNENTDTLLTKLNQLGAKLVPQVLESYLSGKVTKTRQDPEKVSYTWKTNETREKAYFDIDDMPNEEVIDRMARAFYPWPAAWTKWKGKIVKFFPNKMVLLEGKNPVSFKQFKEGYPDFPLDL